MRFPSFDHPVTGTAIPVGALRTKSSCGVGEFLDLIPFADFCAQSSIDLIQLLPINDTGTESSPYSALSAFALHPIYIRFQELPEAEGFSKEILAIKKKYEKLPRYNYRELRDTKLELLHKIFDANERTILASTDLSHWIGKNPWIIEYAVFMNLKRRNFDASWKSWDKHQTPSHSEILSRWNNEQKKKEHLFFAWVQMRLDEQLSKAVEYCSNKGIAVKGDIPIMMNEDSCDAWANPEFFRDDLRAGSPPDDSNPLGQNWGFPIYNWANLKQDGYSWWKQRLSHSAKYFHAYRIDHILGFFRIWAIPYGEHSGFLGWTSPHEPVTSGELASRGFSGDRLRWICQPHVPTNLLEQVNNHDYLGTHGILHTLMDRIGNEELWLFKKEIRHECDIWNSSIPEPVKQALAEQWRNRMILETGRDDTGKPLYCPVWTYKKTTAWNSLSYQERDSLEQLFAQKSRTNELRWKEQAVELLGTLTSSTEMLACAEDLGTIPESVPEVLDTFNILGLKVIRWERKWTEPGQPFKDICAYPVKSVATTSVHDSSTIRGWWEQENGGNDFTRDYGSILDGLPEDTQQAAKNSFSVELAKRVLEKLSETSSALFVVPLQDFLYLDQTFYAENPDDERINVPGSVSTFNWTYRLPVTCEELIKNKNLIASIRSVLSARRTQPKCL